MPPPDTGPDAGPAPPVPFLPSGKSLSFSEVSTFLQCRRQHFYRYFLRLKSKVYAENRHMLIGSMTHDPIEAVYRDVMSGKTTRAEVTRRDSDIYVEDAATAIYREITGPAWKAHFDEDMFRLDQAIAEEMYWVFVEHMLKTEPFEILEPEARFETEFGGRHFIGVADQRYLVAPGTFTFGDGGLKRFEVPPGQYIGEFKTRANSFKKRIRTDATNDLQTEIYVSVFKDAGHDIRGTIRSILKKPPKDLFERDLSMPVQDQIELVRMYYANADPATHFRREIVPLVIDPREVESRLAVDVAAMEAFYANPFGGMVEAPKLYRIGFPCGWCEYLRFCHDGLQVSRDTSFSYKKVRE